MRLGLPAEGIKTVDLVTNRGIKPLRVLSRTQTSLGDIHIIMAYPTDLIIS